MLKFNEELLHFIWRHKLLKPVPLVAHSGCEIVVIKQGELNHDAGPDFFNAQIRVNNLLLAGNIEIHIKSSDWLRHNHQNDRAYDNIILHVVYEHDVELDQNRDNQVEVLELKNYIDDKTIEAYATLAGNKKKLPCESQLPGVSDLKFIAWIERMTIERLEDKVKRMEQLLFLNEGDYTQTFYTCLLRNFGFKVNALPFELVARQLPVHLLLKHADNLMQLEALLLGIAGLLENQFEDPYIQNLQNEFEYLKAKYQLKPLKKELFKFSKLRPANFPNVRLAQFAALVHSQNRILTSPQTFTDRRQLMQALSFELQGYWQKHYTIDGKSLSKDSSFGKSSAEGVIINTFAPFFFLYSKKMAKPELGTLAIALLNDCAPEWNVKTRLFAQKKQILHSAAASQGLVNLYDNYCSARKCLRCGIAASILSPG